VPFPTANNIQYHSVPVGHYAFRGNSLRELLVLFIVVCNCRPTKNDIALSHISSNGKI